MVDHNIMLVSDAIDTNGAEENASKRMGTSVAIISPALGRASIKRRAYTRIGREVLT
jgi:hypothetical protein